MGRSRRELLILGGKAAAGFLLAPQLMMARDAFAATRMPSSRCLSFLNIHTGERLDVEYCAHGEYVKDGLTAIDHLLRDHRTGDVRPIDPQLLDVLHILMDRVDSRGPFHLVSGYRSPKTNRALRGAGRGVAKKSLHLQGMAADVFLPDRSLASLRRAAVSLQAGGVGYYPRTGFVHVDTGPVRTW